MAIIYGVDVWGNHVSFQADAQPLEADAVSVAAGALVAKGAVSSGVTSINGSGNLTVTGNETVGGTLGVTGATTLAAATAISLTLDTGTKTAAATGGAATLNKNAGVITSEALLTAAEATYTLTLTNSTIAAADIVLASVRLGTATKGVPVIQTITPAAGSVVVTVLNNGADAFDGTIKVAFATFA